MFRIFHIREHQRGLWFRKGDFMDVLAPGSTWLLWPNDTVEIVDTLATRFEHKLLDVLIEKPQIRALLEVVDLGSMERAIVWKDGRLFQILGPGRHAFWKTNAKLEIELYSIVSDVRFSHPRVQAILQAPDALKFFDGVMVADHEDVLLYRDGVLIDRLGQGLHVFWKGNGQIKWKSVDRREQTADVAGQEIITADKVTLRVNLVVTYTVADALAATKASTDYTQALYREAQLALRAAVGAKQLDALLADKESVGAEVREALTTRAAELGINVKGVGLRDIILPGDMKTLLNQVISATKEAEANLIRRREETAAARSQANTAKLLAENPLLIRLKELEMLKDVLSGSNATFVLGNGDITEQLRTLVATKSA
jgi:regulator of protease activity HflC (stomatin/prohibitin superfamily)